MELSVSRTALSINGFSVYWYGVLIALGTAATLFFAIRQEKELGFRKDTVIDYLLVVLPAGLAGARAYYVLLHPQNFSSFRDVINLRDGGLAIYGGLIAGFAAGFIMSRIRGDRLIDLCDLVFPNVALAQAVGRWGNFLNEEAYGREITLRFWQFFPAAVKVDGVWYAAAFFYESVWCLGIFLVLTLPRSRKRFTRRGSRAGTYALLYALERCAVEGLRMDSLYLWGNVRASQLLSAVILLAGSAVIFKRDRRRFLLLPLSAAAVAACMGFLPAAVLYICLSGWAAVEVIGFIRVRK